MSEYVLSGGGANGESYDHKTDPTLMLKLYFPGKIQQPLDEMKLACKVFELGIPTPEPGQYVVTDEGRYGILFHRILGKTSYSRATGDHPENTVQYAEEFAQMCLQLHATHVDTSQFENVKDRYARLLAENPFFTSEEKDKLSRFINSVPDEDTAIHGDLQFSNAIFTKDKRYFIDLGDFVMATICSTWEWFTFAATSATSHSSVKPSTWRRLQPSNSGKPSHRPILDMTVP